MFASGEAEFLGRGSMLMPRLLAIEVFGLCGLGRAEGLSSAGGLGMLSRRMVSFLDEAVLGGVLSLTFTQSAPFAGEDVEGLRIPREL